MTDEPEDLASAFFVAGARHVIGSRWPVPGWPTALLMERYALLVTSGRSEVDAMAQARAELRRAFARDGVIHEEVRRGAKQRLVADARPMTDIMVDEVLRALLDEAVQRLRSSWYAELHISVPKPLSPIEGGFESMVRWLPPAPERRRAALDGPKVEGWVDEVLTRFRNPSCWAGWRVVARSLGDLA